MEPDTKNMAMEGKKGMCTHGDHCCGCNNGPMGMCMRHTCKRWLVIVVAIALSFWVGMKLGEIKGFMIAQGYDVRMERTMYSHNMMQDKRAPGADMGAMAPEMDADSLPQ